jgi:excisionase family DNA binding protein
MDTNPDSPFTYRNLAEEAARLKVSRQYLGLLARQGKIPHHRLGRRVIFRSDETDAWVAEHRVAVAMP